MEPGTCKPGQRTGRRSNMMGPTGLGERSVESWPGWETGDPSESAAAVERTTVSLSADNYSLCGVRVWMARTATSQILTALAAGRNPRRSLGSLTRSTCSGARVVGLLRIRWPARWAPPSEHVVDALPVDESLRHGVTVGEKMMRRIPQGGDRKWVASRHVELFLPTRFSFLLVFAPFNLSLLRSCLAFPRLILSHSLPIYFFSANDLLVLLFVTQVLNQYNRFSF